jgi:transposase-like protein
MWIYGYMVRRRTKMENQREQKGLDIAKLPDQIKRIDADTYTVKSQTNNHEYKVFKVNDEWYCECPDHVYRHEKCKHIYAVEFSVSLRAQIRKIEPIDTMTECIYCGSPNIMKYGVRHNKRGNIQVFHCKQCEKFFTFNIGFERMKHNPQAITSAMQLYFSGESLRNTMKSLRLLGVEVSHQTVYKWIRKYVKLMKDYVEKIKPNVSDTWRADELYVKFKGDMKYVFALLDDETRFWIAQEVAETKLKHDVRNLFHMGERLMGKKPMTLITDGLYSYHEAYKNEWYTRTKPRTEHIRHITIKGDRNNNKMERLNGEIRDREKTMRGLKTKETPILTGYQIFHNYIRPHEALEGKTPSEACGITIQGKNKWKTLIQNASRSSS